MKVNPDHVQQSGVDVGRAAADLQSRLSQSDGSIASSLGGWVGNSARAMASKAADWTEATQAYHTDLSAHGEKFVVAAERYRRTDAEAADQINRAGQAVAPAGN